MGGTGLISLVLIFGVFYLFLILPEQKKQKKARGMMNSLKVGDVVLTRGAIQGTIVIINENLVTIKTGPEDAKIDILRTGIGSVIESAPAEDENETEDEAETSSADDTAQNNSGVSLEKKGE